MGIAAQAEELQGEIRTCHRIAGRPSKPLKSPEKDSIHEDKGQDLVIAPWFLRGNKSLFEAALLEYVQR